MNSRAKKVVIVFSLVVFAAVALILVVSLLKSHEVSNVTPVVKQSDSKVELIDKIEVGKCYQFNPSDKSFERFKIKVKDMREDMVLFTYVGLKSEVTIPAKFMKKMFVPTSCK